MKRLEEKFDKTPKANKMTEYRREKITFKDQAWKSDT